MGKYGIKNTPREVMILMAKDVRLVRKSRKITQKYLAEISGVAYATVKKFESTGIISLQSLLKLSDALGKLEKFEKVFEPVDLEDKRYLFDV
jgi:transcriptional regulator with XRE-family HTH domain